MSRRIEPVSVTMIGILSRLHSCCFDDDPWSATSIGGIMGIRGFFGRISLEHEQPTGFALGLDLREECEIVSLGVLPEWRRAGCGSALLASICREALCRGSRSVVLEVAADNVAARALYTSRGFTLVGHRPNYYRRAGRLVDALVLRLALAGI
jgi:[ribosomal protein S18]-alanine N-acetyltransferase